MKSAIVSIGDEILIGQVVNTNAAFIAQRMNDIGIEVTMVTTVGDRETAIESGLRDALTTADVVVATGGLGPTHDDLTKKTVARMFGLPLISDPELRKSIERLLSQRNMKWTSAAEEQTLIPKGAAVIPNRYGTAGGLRLEEDGKVLIVLPGVPYEMEQMINDTVIPYLRDKSGGRVIIHRTLRTTGISESALSAKLGSIDDLMGSGTLAFLPSLSGVRLRLSVIDQSRERAEGVIARAEREIRRVAGSYLYGVEDDELESVVGALLAERGLTIGLAESCTGGMLAQKLTSIPGSSRYFICSVVAYGNTAKRDLLGVPDDLLVRAGAVSEEAARAMAEGIRRVASVDVGLAVTGIAGPGGGTAEKQVGLVWIAHADKEGTTALEYKFGEGRARVVERATVAALDLLRKKLLRLV